MKLSLFELCITRPLGWLIQFIYNLVDNYGLAIILFTVVIKLILMPLQIKSQKAMKRQQKVQPIIMELQKKYANDQQRLQQEMMKVYKENNVSMTGGCLPLLIQFPILIGLYRVIQRPLTYIRGVDFADSQVVENVKANLKQTVYKTIIPRNIRLAEAPSFGMPIIKYDPKSTGAESYMDLAKELILKNGK